MFWDIPRPWALEKLIKMSRNKKPVWVSAAAMQSTSFVWKVLDGKIGVCLLYFAIRRIYPMTPVLHFMQFNLRPSAVNYLGMTSSYFSTVSNWSYNSSLFQVSDQVLWEITTVHCGRENWGKGRSSDFGSFYQWKEMIKMSSDGKQHQVHLKRNSGHCSSIAKPTRKKENNKKLILGVQHVCLWFRRWLLPQSLQGPAKPEFRSTCVPGFAVKALSFILEKQSYLS